MPLQKTNYIFKRKVNIFLRFLFVKINNKHFFFFIIILIYYKYIYIFLQGSGWRKLRNIVQWTPFFQTYKKQRYPWVQLAGHQGNFKAGPDQGTILKKLCAKEEKCFKVN